VWAITIGKHHFWLLPNLTEDCGFFESFVPLYTHSSGETKEDDKMEKVEDDDGDNGTSEDKQEHENKDEKDEDIEGEEAKCSEG
jgi:translocation protein SEC62